MLRKERTINTNNVATVDSVTVGSATSVTISVANPDRIGFYVSNQNGQGLWVKFQDAATDNDKKGIYVSPSSDWNMLTDNIYTGEISVQMNSGNNKTIHYTEI